MLVRIHAVDNLTGCCVTEDVPVQGELNGQSLADAMCETPYEQLSCLFFQMDGTRGSFVMQADGYTIAGNCYTAFH